MADDAGSWAGLLQWVLSNPEKGALFLVLMAGAWTWIKDLRSELRDERRRSKRRANDEPDSERPKQ